MAQPTVLPGTKLLIHVENDASPATFSEPCGLTTKNATIRAATSTTVIPDCADPDAAAWESTDVTSLSFEVSGSGVMGTVAFAVWRPWAESGANKRARIEVDTIGYWEGDFKVTEMTVTGERGQKITIDVTLRADGAVTWTAGQA